MRPSNCVAAKASGTHTVCVCMQHQNVKSVLHAGGLKETIEELLATRVCRVDKEDSMLGKCNMCPGTKCVATLLQSGPALDTKQVNHVQV